MALSAVIIAKNEERHIERCVRSVSFCDEVLVVDSGSQDRTVEIAQALGAKVVSQAWLGYAAQKNYAISLASYDWILSIDADEVVTEELRHSIVTTLSSSSIPFSAFVIARKTFHFGRWIRHGGWYPNPVARLFRRSQGKWEGDELHESWVTAGAVGTLKGDLLHFSFEDLADQVQRNNLYSSLGALQLRRQGKGFSFLTLLTKPLSKFLETYVIKRGFLDGLAGLIISVSAAYSVFLKWAKLWELASRERYRTTGKLARDAEVIP